MGTFATTKNESARILFCSAFLLGFLTAAAGLYILTSNNLKQLFSGLSTHSSPWNPTNLPQADFVTFPKLHRRLGAGSSSSPSQETASPTVDSVPACAQSAPDDPNTSEQMFVSGFWRFHRDTKAPGLSYIRYAKHLFEFTHALGRKLHFYTDLADREVADHLLNVASLFPSVQLHHKPLNQTEFYDDRDRVGEDCGLKFGTSMDGKPVLRLLTPVYHSKIPLLHDAASNYCAPNKYCTHVLWLDLIKRVWVMSTVRHAIVQLPANQIGTMRYRGDNIGAPAFKGLTAETMAGFITVPLQLMPDLYHDYKKAYYANEYGTCFDEETVLTDVLKQKPELFADIFRADFSRRVVFVTAVENRNTMRATLNTVAGIRANDLDVVNKVHIVVMYPIGKVSEVEVFEILGCYDVEVRGFPNPSNAHNSSERLFGDTMGFYAFDTYFTNWDFVVWVRPVFHIKHSLAPFYQVLKLHHGILGCRLPTLPTVALFPESLITDYPELEGGVWISSNIVAFRPNRLLHEGAVQELFDLQRKYPSTAEFSAYVRIWAQTVSTVPLQHRTTIALESGTLKSCH